MKKNSEAHEFALFVDSHNYFVNSKTRTLVLNDIDVIKRIVTVLRLTVGESVILFDTKITYGCTIDEITKKHIALSICNQHEIELQTPELDIVVPLLEREALEEVVYMATVYGVRKIYVIATEKSRKQFTEKDFLRLHKIAVAAAEQSKQFNIPQISHVSHMGHAMSLEIFITKHITEYKDSVKLWCDITGAPVLDVLARVKKAYPSYLIIFGPEGDFTHQEKKLLDTNFTPVKLSKNVLRSRDAATLIMGIIRVHTS